MKVKELEMKMIRTLKKEPINITHLPSGTVTIGIGKAAVMASDIIKLLKKAAGTPYKDGETEEITFGGKTWFLTLEE